MATADQTLAQMVRAKYPGAYDDLSDQELETKVKAKFPGAYDDLPTTPTKTTATAPESGGGMLSTIGDVGVGAVKGAVNTVVGLGELVHKIPGVSSVVDAIYGTPGLSQASFPAARQAVKPTNTAQAVGQGAEQIGEFFVPTGAVGKIGKLAEVAKAGGLTMAQGGSPTAAGVSSALTAALPGGSAAAKLGSKLEASAEQSIVRALGPTKEWAKAKAKDLAPEMLERGIKGSRAAILMQAEVARKATGAKISAELAEAAAKGETISGEAVRQMMTPSAASLIVHDAQGVPRAIEGTEPVIKKLDKLDKFVEALGPEIPVDKAAKIKTAWDRIVDKAGLYGQKVGASSTDAASAWATREAAGAFRKLLASGNPTRDALNKEYAFWKGLKSVLTETEKRTQAQGAGLTATIMGGTGATVGALSGDSAGDRMEKMVLGGLAGRQMVKLLSSAAFRTRVSAPLKNMLADALASGNAARAEALVKSIVKALPAQLRSEIEADDQ